jgi:hypothetical protein
MDMKQAKEQMLIIFGTVNRFEKLTEEKLKEHKKEQERFASTSKLSLRNPLHHYPEKTR